jgi:MYXO-CTERM domain-containing protein
MKSLAVLKRVVLATAGVIAFLGVARPAAAAPFKYFYVITAPPNWGFGNPQPLKSYSALTFTAGAPTSAENYVSLGLLGYPGYWYAYDTFKGEANGFLGADVSIPTAWWVNPVGYWWSTPGVGGPVHGGALLFFNSFSGGTFYADELIIGDPASCDGLCELQDFESYLGISPTNYSVSGPGAVTPPTDDDSLDPSTLPPSTDYVDYDFTTDADATAFVDTPEGPTGIYLLLGIFVIGAGALLRRRRRPLLPAA